MSPARDGLRGVVAGGALGALSCVVPADVPVSLAVLCVVALPAAAWLVLSTPRREVRLLVTLFASAVGVRTAVALVIHYALPTNAFSMDQGLYQYYGLSLAQMWSGEGPGPEQLPEKPGYYLWNALVYTVVGYVPLAATLPNAVIAGLSVLVTHRIAREIAGERAALYAALFGAFFPSLVLWSSLNLKDAAAILSLLLALRAAQILQRGPSLSGLVTLAVGFLSLSLLRHYLVMLVALSVGLALLLPRLRASASIPVTLVLWGLLCACLFAFSDSLQGLTTEANLGSLDQHRRNLAIGDSAYYGNVDVSTPTAALRFLPIGIVYFLLAPAPWQLWETREWLTLPEMLVWYALIPQVFFGMRWALRRRVYAALPVATFAILATVSYALVESNLGTAYRHRAQVLVLYLIFAAVGIATRRSEREAARDEGERDERAPELAGAPA